MKNILTLLIGALMAFAYGNAYADSFGNGLLPIGPTQQISATTSTSSVTLTVGSNYVLVWNQGSVFVFVTCNSTTAHVPGGTLPDSTPIGPLGGTILYVPTGATACAAITSSSSATVDVTPVNLW